MFSFSFVFLWDIRGFFDWANVWADIVLDQLQHTRGVLMCGFFFYFINGLLLKSVPSYHKQFKLHSNKIMSTVLLVSQREIYEACSTMPCLYKQIICINTSVLFLRRNKKASSVTWEVYLLAAVLL